MECPVKITSIFTPTEWKLTATERSNSVICGIKFDTSEFRDVTLYIEKDIDTTVSDKQHAIKSYGGS
jgi:hypothetical protein